MSKFFIERPIFAIVMAIVISIAGVLCMFTLPAVSYTHLDVYKRQPLIWWIIKDSNLRHPD